MSSPMPDLVARDDKYLKQRIYERCKQNSLGKRERANSSAHPCDSGLKNRPRRILFVHPNSGNKKSRPEAAVTQCKMGINYYLILESLQNLLSTYA